MSGFRQRAAQLSGMWRRVLPGTDGVKARVEHALQRSLADQATGIRVEVFGGHVELHGSVPSAAVSSEAERVARATRGAKGVYNFLEVR